MTDTPKKKKTAASLSFVASLKQHHMFRVASVYATVAWVLILVANQVFPDIGLTRDDVRYLIGAVALGFPLVLTFGWMFIPPSQENPEQFSRWKRVRWKLGTALPLAVIAFVTASGIYLWRLNARHMDLSAGPAGPQSIVVLPFDKLGDVDDAMSQGIQQSIEAALSNVGSIRVITHDALPGSLGPHPSLHDLGTSTGATLVVQGSIRRASGDVPYSLQMELVSIDQAEPVFSNNIDYPPKADRGDIQQQTAWLVAGPVHFLAQGDDWLAPGYPTSRNPRALALMRKALMGFYYGVGSNSANPLQTVREAVNLDPEFAQAHAYLAVLEKLSNQRDAYSGSIDAEIARAEQLAPGMPEAMMAKGSLEFYDGKYADAAKSLESVRAPLARSFWLHFDLARSYRYLGRWDDAIHEFQEAEAIDPYQLRTTNYIALIDYGKRDYETAVSILKEVDTRWPMFPNQALWLAQVQFSFHGDLDALARVMDGDWSRYISGDAINDTIQARRIEVAHMQGRHADVIRLLRSYPHDQLTWTLFGAITGRHTFRDSLTVESLRLLGRDAEAHQQAELALPQDEAIAAQSADPLDTLRVALVQAYGDEGEAALKTVAPLQGALAKPAEAWTSDEAIDSVNIAVVLAWSGKKQWAIDLLSRSLTATWGAHAAIVAHDPVWRPLYGEPAFKALLAKYGQALAYAK